MHNQPQEVQGPPVIRLATFLRRVLVYVRPYRMQSLLLIVGMLLDLLFDTALRLSFKFLIDEALIPQNYSLLLSLLAGLSGGIVIAAIAAVGRDYLYARLGTRVVNDLRTALFTHLQGLSMPFYIHTPTREIMARFATDLAAVEYCAGPGAAGWSLRGPGPRARRGAPVLVGMASGAPGGSNLLPLCLLGPRLLKQRTFAASYHLQEARVDIRMEVRTGVLYVLEVNANCGLSSDEETSVGQSWNFQGADHQLIASLLEDALVRFQSTGQPQGHSQ